MMTVHTTREKDEMNVCDALDSASLIGALAGPVSHGASQILPKYLGINTGTALTLLMRVTDQA